MNIKAFTLIELLLVIAVVSIIAALGLLSYRRYFESNRIDKVAISMQHVLEAAMAYYVDHRKWPAAQGCGGLYEVDEFVQDYLPNANAKSYYGSNFCWDDAGAGKSATTPNQGRLFWTALKVPGSNQLAIAKRLAARLPNAITTSEPDSDEIPAPACNDENCYVRAEITIPGTSSNAVSGSAIVAAGECHTGQSTATLMGTGECRDVSSSSNQLYSITAKACPVGTSPVLSINPNFISMPSGDTGLKIHAMSARQLSCQQQANDHTICTATVEVTTCTKHNCVLKNIKNFAGTAAGASYLLICKPEQEV